MYCQNIKNSTRFLNQRDCGNQFCGRCQGCCDSSKAVRPDEAAYFILSHLKGAARQEKRNQTAIVATDSDRTCQIVLDTFGERGSMGSLLREICGTIQQDVE